jgi:hypothetical protein
MKTTKKISAKNSAKMKSEITKKLARNDWLNLGMRSGLFGPADRFTGGAFNVLDKPPKSLLKSRCLNPRILVVLDSVRDGPPLPTRQIASLLNKRFKTKTTPNTINARLAELATCGLIERYNDTTKKGRRHKGAGLWAITPGLDVSNGQSLYDFALAHTAKIKSAANSQTFQIKVSYNIDKTIATVILPASIVHDWSRPEHLVARSIENMLVIEPALAAGDEDKQVGKD